MIYATWKLKKESDTVYSGPEDLLRSSGISVYVVFASPPPQTFLAILDLIPMGIDLSAWDFDMLSSEEAKQFIIDNELPDIPGSQDYPLPLTTTEDLLSLIV
jgi:hypothetical protein